MQFHYLACCFMCFIICANVNGIPQIPNVPDAAHLLGGWYTTILETDKTCLEMNTWQRVIGAFVKTKMSKHICPALRYISVVPLLIVPADWAVGWMTFDYLPNGGNCQAPEGETLCMWLNFYIVILHLIIPLMFLRLFISSYHKLIVLLLHATHALLVAVSHELHELGSKHILQHVRLGGGLATAHKGNK